MIHLVLFFSLLTLWFDFCREPLAMRDQQVVMEPLDPR